MKVVSRYQLEKAGSSSPFFHSIPGGGEVVKIAVWLRNIKARSIWMMMMKSMIMVINMPIVT